MDDEVIQEIEEDVRMNAPIQHSKPHYQEVIEIFKHPPPISKKVDPQLSKFMEVVQSNLSTVQKHFFDEDQPQGIVGIVSKFAGKYICLLYTSPSPRDS